MKIGIIKRIKIINSFKSNAKKRQRSTHSSVNLVLLVMIGLSLIACNETKEIITNPPSDERGYLLEYAIKGSMTANKIISINKDEGDISNYAKNDVEIYSIVYNSILAGEPIEVSGLVMLPKSLNDTLDLIQNHHGTIIPGDDDETPSLYKGGKRGSSEMYFVAATMAANGYVVSMPDYVGYGITSDIEHPYTVHHELAEVSVDMLRATKQLLRELSKSFSNDVYLTGWSEGGGAGLATHKYLQEHYAGEFNIKASSLFAGPYDYFEFVKDIFINRYEEDDELSIYSWAIYALNKYSSSLNRDEASIWSYTVSDQLDALYIPSEIAADIFQQSFLDNFINEVDIELVNVIEANTLLKGWNPQGALFFHSGTLDFIVPHYNSVNAHQYFQSIGVNSTLYEYADEDHYTPLYEYVTTTLEDFNTL